MSDISKVDVLGVLLPIWTDKNYTARKLRQKISASFDWSVANGHAEHNAANGELDGVLPVVKRETTRYKAIDWQGVPDAFAKIGTVNASDSAIAALGFAILTAVRSDESRSATWDQVDFDACVWTATVKGGKTNRIPLSDAAVAILRAQQGPAHDVRFPESADAPPVSHAAFGRILKAAGIDSTTHGFPVVLLDMGARRDGLRARHDRNLHGAHGRKRGQSGIRQRRPVRKAPRPDDGLVGVRDRRRVARPAGAEQPRPLWSGGCFAYGRAGAGCTALYGRSRVPARCRQPSTARAP